MSRSLQDRFLADVEQIVRDEEAGTRPRERIVMLSGGTDSLLLVVVLRRVFPDDDLCTIHVQGVEGDDSRGALAVATRFGTRHHVFEVALDDLLDNLHRVGGKGYTGVSRVISHICYELCFERYDVEGCNVYHGDGADALYGNTRRVAKLAEQLVESGRHESLEEARTEAKRTCYPEEMKDKRYFAELAARFGARAIMPYTDPRLGYLSAVPFSVLGPSNKSFVKDAMRRRYDLDAIVDRERVSMQAGLGLRDQLRDALSRRYPSDSVSRIVRRLTSRV